MNFKAIVFCLGIFFVNFGYSISESEQNLNNHIDAILFNAQSLSTGHPDYKKPIVMEEEVLLENLIAIEKEVKEIDRNLQITRQNVYIYETIWKTALTIWAVKKIYDFACSK